METSSVSAPLSPSINAEANKKESGKEDIDLLMAELSSFSPSISPTIGASCKDAFLGCFVGSFLGPLFSGALPLATTVLALSSSANGCARQFVIDGSLKDLWEKKKTACAVVIASTLIAAAVDILLWITYPIALRTAVMPLFLAIGLAFGLVACTLSASSSSINKRTEENYKELRRLKLELENFLRKNPDEREDNEKLRQSLQDFQSKVSKMEEDVKSNTLSLRWSENLRAKIRQTRLLCSENQT